MTDANPRQNGKYLRFERAEDGSDLSHGDALLIRRACEKWLEKNDPRWISAQNFDFGSLTRKRRAA
jgi:hypothetical protein